MGPPICLLFFLFPHTRDTGEGRRVQKNRKKKKKLTIYPSAGPLLCFQANVPVSGTPPSPPLPPPLPTRRAPPPSSIHQCCCCCRQAAEKKRTDAPGFALAAELSVVCMFVLRSPPLPPLSALRVAVAPRVGGRWETQEGRRGEKGEKPPAPKEGEKRQQRIFLLRPWLCERAEEKVLRGTFLVR